MATVPTDALQPALRTTRQLLGELGFNTTTTTTDASSQALDLLGELKDVIGRKDQELRRCLSLSLPCPLHPTPCPFLTLGLMRNLGLTQPGQRVPTKLQPNRCLR